MSIRRCAAILVLTLLAPLTGSSIVMSAQTPKPKPSAPKAPAKPPAKPPVAKKPAETKPAPPPPPVDVVVASTYTTGEKTSTSTVSIKGARQRIEYGNDLVTVVHCDASQTIQLNAKTKTYLATPLAAAPAAPEPAPANAKGGQITYTTTVTDPGEKKEMFGHQARRLLTVVTKESSPTACDKKPERVETDGWYIDLPATMTCTAAAQAASRVQVDPKNANCRDEVRFERASTVVVGYPLAYTMTASAGSDKPATTTLETTALNTLDLPAAQFELPADYLEVKTVNQLMADHRPGEIVPKKPGVVRIGVAHIGNKTDLPIANGELSEALGESLSESDLDIVALRGTTAAEISADAVAKECDFILENTVTELKKPGKGMLGKLAGTSAEAISARVDYTLKAPGQTKPVVADSQRSGTSTLQNAIGAATKVAKIIAPLLLAQYSFMSQFSTMNGGASPMALGQTSDPVLGSVFKLLDRAAAPRSQENYSTEDSAVAAALEKEIQAVFAEMQKKKKK